MHPRLKPVGRCGPAAINKYPTGPDKLLDQTVRRIRKELPEEGINALACVIVTYDQVLRHGSAIQ